MKPLIEFKVTSKVLGKGRGRAFLGPKKGGGKTIRVFTPAETVKSESNIGFQFLKAAGADHRLYEGPLRLTMETRHVVPQSYPKKRALACHSGQERPTKKPDADNAAKLVMDALNGKAYHDDTQVVEFEIKKFYVSEPGVPEHMIIRIYQLGPEDAS